MAETEYHRGDMDIHAQRETFHHVMVASKWGSLAVVVSVLFLALWFCTAAGFFNALVTAVVVLALGIFFLRERGHSH